MLTHLIVVTSVLAVIALLITVLNAFTESIFPSCNDPIMFIAVGNLKISTAFQYIWVILNCLVVTVMCSFIEYKRRVNWGSQAQHVYECICTMVNALDSRLGSERTSCLKIGLTTAVDIWKENLTEFKTQGRQGKLQQLLYFVLHIPIGALASAPAGGYTTRLSCALVVESLCCMQSFTYCRKIFRKKAMP